MIREIQEDAKQRGITRLCHFTPSRKFLHMIGDGKGILSSARLEVAEKDVFDPTDRLRIDGYPGHVCCSIEYPNVYYFRQAKLTEVVYPDWLVLFIQPHHLWMEGTLFCPRNAAAARGAYVAAGGSAYRRLFAQQVVSDRVPVRSTTRLPAAPTDIQAEVLVPEGIPMCDILGVCVATVDSASRLAAQLRLAGVNETTIRYIVAPDLFHADQLRAALQAGRRPGEDVWRPPAADSIQFKSRDND